MSKLALAVLIFSLCAHLALGQKDTKVTAAEYAVYAAVLRGIYKENRRDYSNESQFVFVEETLTSEDLSAPTAKQYRPLVKKFEKLNRNQAQLERRFPKGDYSKTYYLISQEELDELFREGQAEYEKRKEEERRTQKLREVDICGGTQWQPFYRKYPEASGYYKLSRAALSRNLAIVRVKGEDVCGGFDLTYILKKTRKGWGVVWSAGSGWVS